MKFKFFFQIKNTCDLIPVSTWDFDETVKERLREHKHELVNKILTKGWKILERFNFYRFFSWKKENAEQSEAVAGEESGRGRAQHGHADTRPLRTHQRCQCPCQGELLFLHCLWKRLAEGAGHVSVKNTIDEIYGTETQSTVVNLGILFLRVFFKDNKGYYSEIYISSWSFHAAFHYQTFC